MKNILEEIAASVKEQITAQRLIRSEADLLKEFSYRPKNFREIFLRPSLGPKIIAEVKLASPSEGDMALGADPVAVASDYLSHGAVALSVLTEEKYFKGSPHYLRSIRGAHPQAYLLMKDFILDEYQLLRARADGADAVLLIVALLGAEKLQNFLRRSQELSLAALVEVHDEAELEIAADCGANLIGVNNRSLKAMTIDLETSVRLIKKKKSAAVFISESGLKNPMDLKKLQTAGFDGFLIGSEFMRGGRPGSTLKKLIEQSGGRHD